MPSKLSDAELDEIKSVVEFLDLQNAPSESADGALSLADRIDFLLCSVWGDVLNREEQIERLREALQPFALFGRKHVDGRDDILSSVVSIGNQTLTVGAFQMAVEAVNDG